MDAKNFFESSDDCTTHTVRHNYMQVVQHRPECCYWTFEKAKGCVNQ